MAGLAEIGMAALDKGGEEPPESMGDDYSAAKEAAATRLASALGVDPEQIDAAELCAAVKEIMELESE